VDQNPIAGACEWQAIRLAHPPPYRARVSFELSGEGLKIQKIVEKIA
jgi:hypothetical protein